ncbi:MAG: sodium:proton antiporter, partial [Planctomycetaceae bacterium]|nr:sodium:proton antiporter [Planctomycetaceae bacterium]
MTQNEHPHAHVNKVPRLGLVALIIFLILCGYGYMVSRGLPQGWTQQVIEAEHGDHGTAHGEESQSEAKPAEHPPYLMVAPFALLLLSIAILPLVPATAHWWESNLHRFYVAAGLGLVTLLYYGFFSHFPLEGHWPAHYEIA